MNGKECGYCKLLFAIARGLQVAISTSLCRRVCTHTPGHGVPGHYSPLGFASGIAPSLPRSAFTPRARSKGEQGTRKRASRLSRFRCGDSAWSDIPGAVSRRFRSFLSGAIKVPELGRVTPERRPEVIFYRYALTRALFIHNLSHLEVIPFDVGTNFFYAPKGS
jgi:hypothetical protein